MLLDVKVRLLTMKKIFTTPFHTILLEDPSVMDPRTLLLRSYDPDLLRIWKRILYFFFKTVLVSDWNNKILCSDTYAYFLS
jgi:hypothetical protein